MHELFKDCYNEIYMIQPIHFLHISDTHLGPDKNFMQHDVNTHVAFSHFIKSVKDLPFNPDFIIHTGDITADCYDKGYELMASEVDSMGIPIYFVTGNHDRSIQIRNHLMMKDIHFHSVNLNTYSFTFGDDHFLTIDGRGPDDIDPHGVISEEQMNILKTELETGKNLTIFIHYPALSLDSMWFDENMLITNGNEFHELLVLHKEHVRGVFFGHIHRTTQTYKDGILYASVGSTAIQFHLNPDQKEPMFESTGRGYFNIVSMDAHQVTIKQQSFANEQTLYEYQT